MVEWVSCGISAIIAFIAWRELGKINKQMEFAVKNQKQESLRIVLEIESQMNSRKLECNKAAKLIREAKEANPGVPIPESLLDYLETTEESFLNSIDRLCFCILKEYIIDKDWKCEYRNLIRDTIKDFPESFTEASPYRNIINLNRKWQDE